ncbi:MAG: hypothetical protein A2X86_19325 [Bdellovibrionales bacterium GWA2_49_15]|nr:MAG: hypothetical protein A2X86_19325 [Bdellovibrionales bacterium GWA2_49_15]HAZ14381.1 hypothetical protein [Bdellovibrionales bacterium]
MQTEQELRKHRSFKNIVINPKLQWGILGYFGFVALQTIGYLFYAAIEKNNGLKNIIDSLGIESPELTAMLQRQELLMSVEFAGITVMYFLFFAGGLYLSHKIAGPMYKLQKHLRECREQGKLDHVTFRPGDFFTEVSDEYNAFIDYIKSREQK